MPWPDSNSFMRYREPNLRGVSASDECPVLARICPGKVMAIEYYIALWRRTADGVECGTHEGLAPLPVFKTGAFNRSATHPRGQAHLNAKTTTQGQTRASKHRNKYSRSIRGLCAATPPLRVSLDELEESLVAQRRLGNEDRARGVADVAHAEVIDAAGPRPPGRHLPGLRKYRDLHKTLADLDFANAPHRRLPRE
jgi:hypothetical protein